MRGTQQMMTEALVCYKIKFKFESQFGNGTLFEEI